MAVMNFIKRLTWFFSATIPYTTSTSMNVEVKMGMLNAGFRFERVDEKVIADSQGKNRC